MKAADKIRLDKALRFARMATQALDDLIYNGKPTKSEAKVLADIEALYHDAETRLQYMKVDA